MQRTPYLRTPSGRLIATSTALAVVGAGLVALSPAGLVIYVMTLIPMLCVVAAILGLGLAVNDYGAHAALLCLALPVMGGAYWGALNIAAGHPGAWGWGLVGLALVPAFLAVRGGGRGPESRTSSPTAGPA